VIAILVALQTVGVDLTPLLAGATVVGATIGFGAQSLVRDLLSGFLLTAEDQFGIGDTIITGTTTGVVEDVTLRVTRVRARDGTVWFVPNGEIRVVANTSRGWALATVEAIVPVGSDVDAVLETLRTVADGVVAEASFAPFCLEAPRVWGVVASDDTTFSARVTVRTTAVKREPIEQALRDGVARGLRAAGIYEAPGPASGDVPGDVGPDEA
jgi:small-conductance mechanosensitive channel